MGGHCCSYRPKTSRDTTDFFLSISAATLVYCRHGSVFNSAQRTFSSFLEDLMKPHLKVAFNDVDFCLKLHEGGYQNTYIGDVELYHLESISRGCEDTPEKQARFQREISTMIGRWGEQLIWDPFYSAHYSRSPPFLRF